MATTIGGLEVKNRVWVGSSELTMTLEGIRACIDGGAGAVVVKSINESQAAQDQLNIGDYVFVDELHRPVWAADPKPTDSLFNRSGLAQTTLDDWIELLDEAQRYAAAHDSAVVGSITVAEPTEAGRIAARLSEVVPAIEINVGAPHGREANGAVRQLTEASAVGETMAAVRRATTKPVFLKLPSTASDLQSLALSGQEQGAEAIVFAGRYNGFIPDIDTYEPVLGSWGAYSGGWALPMSLYSVSKAFRSDHLTVPIIGTNGARSAEDVVRFLISGASAVELVTLLWMKGPAVVTTILEGIDAYLASHGLSDTGELVGCAARNARQYSEIEPLATRKEPWHKHLDKHTHRFIPD